MRNTSDGTIFSLDIISINGVIKFENFIPRFFPTVSDGLDLIGNAFFCLNEPFPDGKLVSSSLLRSVSAAVAHAGSLHSSVVHGCVSISVTTLKCNACSSFFFMTDGTKRDAILQQGRTFN